jgi:uncharacterized protein (DUF885 family)
VAKDNFSALVDDLAELDKRRGADGQITKALRTAGDAARSEIEFKSWLGDLGRRAEIREAEDRQTQVSERNRLAKAIEHGTALLRKAVSDGSLTAVDACRYESQIHALNDRLAGLRR